MKANIGIFVVTNGDLSIQNFAFVVVMFIPSADASFVEWSSQGCFEF